MSATAIRPDSAIKASWLPLIVVVLTQIQASFAVNALTVSMAGITSDLNMPATSVGTAITTGTFAMAAFILLGAKIGAKFGSRRVFQIAVLIHAVSMAAIAVSFNSGMLLLAQAASGAVIALIAPALVVFISTNYSGTQQAKAIGYLAAAIPAAGVLALLIAGSFAGSIGWRWSFVLVAALGVINFLLSFRFKVVPADRALVIDWPGALIAAGSIILLSFGFSGLTSWGAFRATSSAPFSVLGLSPAPVLIVLGIVGVQLFYSWLRTGKAQGAPRIFDLAVLRSGEEKATTFCMSLMLFIGTAANFLIPLYIQVVQGRTGLQTSLSIIPYTISIFVANSIIASFYTRFAPRQIARAGFVVVAVALVLIAFSIRNDWGQVAVVIGLILLGLGQGAIVALVFNTLLSAATKRLAGDVGAWRGLVHNISGSVGIAVATVFAVTMLASFISTGLLDHPTLPLDLQAQFPLDSVNFVTNSQLEQVLSSTTGATAGQIQDAISVNETARLQALKISLIGLAALALLAIVPAGRMPARIRTDDDEDEPAEPAEPAADLIES